MKTEKEQKEIYFMQSVVLTNYAKLCIKLNEVPRLEVIEQTANCEDLKTLVESNKLILSKLK
jgi:hypothetical protein